MSRVTDSLALPDQTASLPQGGRMPLLGFGTWQLTGDDARRATADALQVGYRHLDTATLYDNEREVGLGLVDSGVPRADVFVTTKLPPDRGGSERPVLEESLEKLGVEYVDLWLIHWPPGGAGESMWQALLDARDAGLARDVGVSNYSLEQLDALHSATGVMPAVNQINWSPLRFDQAVVDGHRERGVVLEGYSGLRGGTLDNPVIVEIAERLGRTPAQVILRWHLQHEFVAIPKSANAERIRANAQLADFELTADDMSKLDALGGS
jgi:diketogulonate reductase-like aldo/keto reductase